MALRAPCRDDPRASPRLRRARIRSAAHAQCVRVLSVARVCTMPDIIWTIAPSTRHSWQAFRRSTSGPTYPLPLGLRLRLDLQHDESLAGVEVHTATEAGSGER